MWHRSSNPPSVLPHLRCSETPDTAKSSGWPHEALRTGEGLAADCRFYPCHQTENLVRPGMQKETKSSDLLAGLSYLHRATKLNHLDFLLVRVSILSQGDRSSNPRQDIARRPNAITIHSFRTYKTSLHLSSSNNQPSQSLQYFTKLHNRMTAHALSCKPVTMNNGQGLSNQS